MSNSDNNSSTANAIITKILELCAEQNWTLYRLSKETNIPYSSLNNMIKRKTLPSITTLIKICNGLHVAPADFLFSIHYTLATNKKYMPLSTDEFQMVENFKKLDADKQALVISYINELSDN